MVENECRCLYPASSGVYTWPSFMGKTEDTMSWKENIFGYIIFRGSLSLLSLVLTVLYCTGTGCICPLTIELRNDSLDSFN